MAIDLDMKRIPEHIAIIMDGNGRWATEEVRTEASAIRQESIRCVASLQSVLASV